MERKTGKIFDNGHRLRKTSSPRGSCSPRENRAIESLMWKRATREKGVNEKEDVKEEMGEEESEEGGGGKGSG